MSPNKYQAQDKNPKVQKGTKDSRENLEAQNNPLKPNPDKIMPYGG
ncbi:MAG: hypothetical protein FWB74_02650 [Defluviitaleaceae bacterium]|nr:hypothetical protein [Defluviitaleaceae bacterium]